MWLWYKATSANTSTHDQLNHKIVLYIEARMYWRDNHHPHPTPPHPPPPPPPPPPPHPPHPPPPPHPSPSDKWPNRWTTNHSLILIISTCPYKDKKIKKKVIWYIHQDKNTITSQTWFSITIFDKCNMQWICLEAKKTTWCCGPSHGWTLTHWPLGVLNGTLCK